MRIYTRTGDRGETGLAGGGRVSKDSPRIRAYGDVDELNAVLGQVRAQQPAADMDALLSEIQSDLFDLGAVLASPGATSRLPEGRIAELEAEIDRYQADLPPLRNFVLPGGTALAGALHLARTVCRRAEREVVALDNGLKGPGGGPGEEGVVPPNSVPPNTVMYLNRLSDLLFVLARAANHRAGVAEVLWRGDRKH